MGANVLDSQFYFDLEAIIKIPKDQEVIYIPNSTSTMINAWVQYFSIFIFFYLILYRAIYG